MIWDWRVPILEKGDGLPWRLLLPRAGRRRPGVPPPEPVKSRLLSRELAVSVFATSMASMPAFLVGALAVQIRQSFPLSTAELGAAVTCYYLGAAVWAVPSGKVAEYFGGIRVLRLTPLIGAALLLAIAGFASSWWLVTLLLFPAGMVSSATATATNLFLAVRGRPDRQGTVFGIKQAAVPLATLLGGVAVPTVALTVGWRYAFVLAALASIVTAIAIPRPRSDFSTYRQRARSSASPQLDRLPLALLAAGLGLGMLAASGIAAFLVSSAVAGGLARSSAGLLAAGAGAVTVAVRILAGARADRSGKGSLPTVAAMMLAGAGGFLVLGAGQIAGAGLLVAMGALAASGLGWGWNGLLNYAVVDAYRKAPARATGVTQLGGRLGGMVGPILLGLVISHLGYGYGWITAAIAATLAAAATLAGSRLLERAGSGKPA